MNLYMHFSNLRSISIVNKKKNYEHKIQTDSHGPTQSASRSKMTRSHSMSCICIKTRKKTISIGTNCHLTNRRASTCKCEKQQKIKP